MLTTFIYGIMLTWVSGRGVSNFKLLVQKWLSYRRSNIFSSIIYLIKRLSQRAHAQNADFQTLAPNGDQDNGPIDPKLAENMYCSWNYRSRYVRRCLGVVTHCVRRTHQHNVLWFKFIKIVINTLFLQLVIQ